MIRIYRYCVCLLLLLSSSVVFGQYLNQPANTIFLEAERFENKGGWVVDQQFMDQMGSPVLMAHGFGVPVADATTKVVFPTKGTYRVFVRTRNWVAPWTEKYAPGQFHLAIDQKNIETSFGSEGEPWHWQQGANIAIDSDQKEVLLSLKDQTGFDGRVDAICFTKDPNFVPPNDRVKLSALRDQVRPDQGQLETSNKQYDLVVVGGGLAGVCSAISAARLGCQVALIQDRPVLGGNGSTEIRVHLNGEVKCDPYPNIGNLTYLMGPHGGGNAREKAHYKDESRLELVLAEKNISLFLNTHVNQAECDEVEGSRVIRSVIGENIETGKRIRFSGKLFADCTGDGTLGFLAGADWRIGRESKAETGEALAPEIADKLTMGSSIQWNTVVDPKNNKFPILPWALQFNEDTIIPLDHGDWYWEAGLKMDQINDIEKIRDIGLRAAYGHWSYMKNQIQGEWAEKVKNRRFGWVSYVAGKRESRRLLGDIILTQQDVEGQKKFEDASFTTTWSLDLHYPDPKNEKYFPGEEFISIAKQLKIKPYAMPYRCLYSRNVSNLFMAGRNISVTHVVLGSIRVMRTGGMMGEVVGMAASICKKHDCLPRKVYQSYLSELQEQMKKGVAPEPKEIKPPEPSPDSGVRCYEVKN